MTTLEIKKPRGKPAAVLVVASPDKWSADEKPKAKRVAGFRVEESSARALISTQKLFQAADCKLVTFTAQPMPGESLRDGIERMRAALGRLQRLRPFRSHVSGGVMRIEFERSTPSTRERAAKKHDAEASSKALTGDIEGAEHQRDRATELRSRVDAGTWWHVHAHAILSCGFWAHHELLALWARASRTTKCGVDIRHPKRGALGVVAEIAKYCTKPVSFAWLTVADVVEVITATEKKRMLWCFGALYGVKIDDGDAAPSEEQQGLVDDDVERAKKEGRETFVGVHPTTGEFLQDSQVWWDHSPEAAEERRAAMEALWDAHEARRRRLREAADEDDDALPAP